MTGKYEREALADIERIANENPLEPNSLVGYAGRSGALRADVRHYATMADFEFNSRQTLLRNQDIWFREFSRLASHKQMLGLMRNINTWLTDSANHVNGVPMATLDDAITDAEDALFELEDA